MTSLPGPRIKHHLSPAHHDTRTHQETPEGLSPAFSQPLNDEESMLQPGRPLVRSRLPSPRVIGCSTTSEPLHLIIGGDGEESAEGYAIPPLGEDFLFGNQVRTPQYRSHDENLQPGPFEIPRRPQQFQHPLKRRSVEFSPVCAPSSPALPAPTHPRQTELADWNRAESGRENASNNMMGHRRSSSYGNSPQLWTGVTQQQSMPCISKLPDQGHSPLRYGE